MSATAGPAPSGLARILEDLDVDSSSDAGVRVGELVSRYLKTAYAGTGSVSTSRTPEEIASRFDEALPRGGSDFDVILGRIEHEIVADANRLAHPMAMGHQVSPPLAASIWTDAIISALNQSIAVSEMSPSLTPVENRVIGWMTQLVGFGAGSGGTFTSGGTEATFSALLAARAAACPDAWDKGIGADPPIVICSEHAHYAVKRAVGQLGIGARNTIALSSPDVRLDPRQVEAVLREARDAGRRVMAVVATAGSTATGSFDDLEAIGSLCDQFGVWMHVDAAHGGSALLSSKHRHKLRGLSRARSIAWDAHKMMLMPLPAGMLLVRDERDLERAFAQSAPYLFHAPEGERVIDQGVRSFMCSRRADALKVWVALQRYGADGLGAIYDALCETTRALYGQIADRGDFEALHEPECNILCFRSTCDTMPDDQEERNRRTQRARERYNRSGEGWITTTMLNGERVFRVTIMNPRTTPELTWDMLEGLATAVREVA